MSDLTCKCKEQLCYCGDIFRLGVVHREDGFCTEVCTNCKVCEKPLTQPHDTCLECERKAKEDAILDDELVLPYMLEQHIKFIVELARQRGYTITVENKALYPLAMGNTEPVVSVRDSNKRYRSRK